MRKTDETVSQLKNLLTPEQAAKFLLLSDKVKLTKEFDVFTLYETSKRKKEQLQQVFERITPDRDGRLVLKRDEEGQDTLMNNQAMVSQLGLQQIGD
mmetsp:Transcript_41172/g.54074  ORF Transcript_41172/g.54074 Transcript_41172/m.54074 type:complete len:97 (+) Transcript_41172:2704-2994(+)